MVDNEKQEHLANARRKLRKFRDQQQRQNGGDDLMSSSGTNGNGTHIINGASSDFVFENKLSEPKDVASFVEEQQAILNQLHESLSKSPIVDLEEQNRQYELLLESQKQQRARLEEQCQYGVTSSMSGRSSQNMFETDTARQLEHKYRRELDHLQEQLEIHVQTIGILVAEKTDLSAKLTQASKQIERKQSEVDEVAGRLKASRERVDELERYSLNSSSSAQKREMEAKEFDKEIDRLKMENFRQNQTIDEMKQALTEVENKFKHRQVTIDELNNEVSRLKQKLEQADIRLQQFQSVNDMSLVDSYEQRVSDLKQLVHAKSNEIEVFSSMNKQLQFDHDQVALQHQQYIANVQRHIQELNEQIRQLTEANMFLQNQQEITRKSYEARLAELVTDQNQLKSSINADIVTEKDSLHDENELLKSTINDWSIKFQSMRVENEKLTNEIIEKDQQLLRLHIDMERFRESAMEHEKLLETIQEDKATISRALAQNKQLKEQLAELQDGFVKLSNDNMNLATRFQAQEHLNKQLEERLTHEHQPTVEQTSVDDRIAMSNNNNAEEINTLTQRVDELGKENNRLKAEIHRLVQRNPAEEDQKIQSESVPLSSTDLPAEEKTVLEKIFVEKIIERFNRAMRDNADLQDRTQQMEHLILQLQSETETIGDYISLYQQQRQQLSRRYQEKDDYIKQLTQERLNLQRKLSELEIILIRALNKPPNNIPTTNLNPISTTNPVSQTDSTEQPADENEWPDMVDNPVESAPNLQSDELKNSENRSESVDMQSIENSTLDFDEETKQRILTLLKEIGQVDSSSKTDDPSTTKLAFVGKNLYVCSTCTGPVQWV